MFNATVTQRRYALLMRRAPAPHDFRRADEHGAVDAVKRVVDLLIASILVAITAPLLLLVSLAITLESPGPVLASETCIGRGGRRCQVLRFRTVVLDREQKTRIRAPTPTRVGEVLHYTRIETLPELLNVLRGDTSIIDRKGSSPSFLD